MAGQKGSNSKGGDDNVVREEQLNEEEMEALYAWVDTIPLSRPKRNITRDFSDGVLVAEVIKHGLPKEHQCLVELHNYTPAFNTNKKKENWYYLNRKVFSKMNFELAEDVINDLVCCKAGMIEKVLLMLQVKIRRVVYEKERMQNPKPEADQHQVSPGRNRKTIKVGMDESKGPKGKSKQTYGEDYGGIIDQRYLQLQGWNSGIEQHNPIPKKRPPGNTGFDDKVPRLLVEEREQELLAKDEMVKIMQAKITRMEHLLHLKDLRIDDLQSQVESLRPTGRQYRPPRKQ